VFCVFNLCMHILYSEYIFYITCCFYVTWLYITWLVYSSNSTRVHSFVSRPPKRPTGVYIVPSPRFLLSSGLTPRGVATAWAQCITVLSKLYICHHAPVKHSLFLSHFKETSVFSTDFRKNDQISNFVKIRPVGTELFNADGRTVGQRDMAKFIVIFRNFAKAPRNTGAL